MCWRGQPLRGGVSPLGGGGRWSQSLTTVSDRLGERRRRRACLSTGGAVVVWWAAWQQGLGPIPWCRRAVQLDSRTYALPPHHVRNIGLHSIHCLDPGPSDAPASPLDRVARTCVRKPCTHKRHIHTRTAVTRPGITVPHVHKFSRMYTSCRL